MSHGRKLTWFGMQGVAQYDGCVLELRSRPHVDGVREFMEIDYQPSAHRALIRPHHQRGKLELSTHERAMVDGALDRMTRIARSALHKT